MSGVRVCVCVCVSVCVCVCVGGCLFLRVYIVCVCVHRWVVYFEDGEWCFTEEECRDRSVRVDPNAQTVPFLNQMIAQYRAYSTLG